MESVLITPKNKRDLNLIKAVSEKMHTPKKFCYYEIILLANIFILLYVRMRSGYDISIDFPF